MGSAVPKFQKILNMAKDRDLNESDTVSIITDIMAELFGYDKYLELTSEFMVRGTYCDLAVKLDGKVHFLLEAKAIGLDLKDSHLKQAIDYGANLGVQWVILTNGIVWRLYRIRFEKPINFDLICEFNFLSISPKQTRDQEQLYVLCKEGLQKKAHEDYYEVSQNVNRYIIGNILLGEAVLYTIRKKLKRLSDGIRVEESEIERILRTEVLKRDILEGENAEKAINKILRLNKKSAQKIKKDNKEEDMQKIALDENIDKLSENITTVETENIKEIPQAEPVAVVS